MLYSVATYICTEYIASNTWYNCNYTDDIGWKDRKIGRPLCIQHSKSSKTPRVIDMDGIIVKDRAGTSNVGVDARVNTDYNTHPCPPPHSSQ